MQARLPRCARRRVDRSGQAWHPRLRAGGAARDGAAGPCGGTSGAEGLEWQRLAAVRDSTECCALLLRTCNPSKRHREGSAVSGMRVLSPGGPWKGLQEGYLGSDMAKLSPGGQRGARGGSDWPILSPRGHQGSASDSDQEEPAGSASGSHREGHAGSQRKIVQLSENNYLCRN